MEWEPQLPGLVPAELRDDTALGPDWAPPPRQAAGWKLACPVMVGGTPGLSSGHSRCPRPTAPWPRLTASGLRKTPGDVEGAASPTPQLSHRRPGVTVAHAGCLDTRGPSCLVACVCGPSSWQRQQGAGWAPGSARELSRPAAPVPGCEMPVGTGRGEEKEGDEGPRPGRLP